jgi:hypothetical protein
MNSSNQYAQSVVKPQKVFLSKLRETQGTIESRACEEIKFSEPLLTLNEFGVLFPNSITVIQGQKGVHKSRLTENFCAAFLSKKPDADFVGFKVRPLMRFRVVYVDTERNINDQFPFSIQRIKELIGRSKSEKLPAFEPISLIDIDRSSRFEALSELLEDIRANHPDEHIIVVLDVVTDCVKNFNDAADSLRLIDHLNMIINRHNVAFICVIHENPNANGESKARGHLGTEIINKATTVISIGFERAADKTNTELICVKFLHTRNSQRPPSHYLKYSQEAKGLVVADPNFVADQKSKRQKKATITEVKQWLSKSILGRMSKEDLVEKLTTEFSCVPRTIESRLNELAKGESSFLESKKDGKRVFYELRAPF